MGPMAARTSASLNSSVRSGPGTRLSWLLHVHSTRGYAGVIALATELTPVSKIAAFLLTVAGGVAFLNVFICDFRDKKSLCK